MPLKNKFLSHHICYCLRNSWRWKVLFSLFAVSLLSKTRWGMAVYQCELLLATALSSILQLPDQCEIHQRSIHSCNVWEVILPPKFISPNPSCYFKARLISALPSLLWIIRGHPQAMWNMQKRKKIDVCFCNIPHEPWPTYCTQLTKLLWCQQQTYEGLRCGLFSSNMAFIETSWTFVSGSKGSRQVPDSMFACVMLPLHLQGN